MSTPNYLPVPYFVSCAIAHVHGRKYLAEQIKGFSPETLGWAKVYNPLNAEICPLQQKRYDEARDRARQNGWDFVEIIEHVLSEDGLDYDKTALERARKYESALTRKTHETKLLSEECDRQIAETQAQKQKKIDEEKARQQEEREKAWQEELQAKQKIESEWRQEIELILSNWTKSSVKSALATNPKELAMTVYCHPSKKLSGFTFPYEFALSYLEGLARSYLAR